MNKINNASCQQSHLAGVNNIYNDLHTAIVGQNDLQRLGAANGQNVRVSKYTEPFFYFFKPDDGSDILYRGGCTFGGGKMDKATWGYAKKFKGLKSIKKFCMFEGSDNSLTGTDFRVPFIWKPQGSCPDEMTYSTDDEGFGVSEGTGTDRKWSQCWDFDGGATYSADDETWRMLRIRLIILRKILSVRLPHSITLSISIPPLSRHTRRATVRSRRSSLRIRQRITIRSIG